MGNLAARKKKRRQYLWKKGQSLTVAALTRVLIFPAVSATFMMFAATCVAVYLTIFRNLAYGMEYIVLSAGLTTLGAVFAITCDKHYRKSVEATSRLAYVPPVKDALSAEGILVRASEEPPIPQKEVLLRAAMSAQEESSEELLRAAEGE